MTDIVREEARQIIAALRTGVVPDRGLHHFAVGLDPLLAVVGQELEYVAEGGGRGLAKWLRGEYGSGKTFATRLICSRARAEGFATTEVQISVNDTPLHHLETVYRRMMERLTTDTDGAGAFGAVIDGWLFQLGEEVRTLSGLDESDPAFGAAVERRLEDRLNVISTKAPAFAQVLRAYHQATGEADFARAQGLLAWLAGQPHVARAIMSSAGVKGSVDGAAALGFLRGMLEVLRQSGYRGLVVVLDEVETLQRIANGQTREKWLNALRQIIDLLLDQQLPGLYLVVTGTPELFDGYKGLKALAPLYQRVATRFGDDPQHDNLRAPQVRLPAFDDARLMAVGRHVRDLFPAANADRVRARVSDTFLSALVRETTSGFGGKVSVVPRLFLRELVDVLDRVDLHDSFDPEKAYRLSIDEAELRPEELAARKGVPVPDVQTTDDDASPTKVRLEG
jgi:hypothetical protein